MNDSSDMPPSRPPTPPAMPLPNTEIATTAPTPTMSPNIVKSERSLFAKSTRNASTA